MTPSLYLLDPLTPDPAWAPFLGVRPICELLAGACRIRERWEAGFDTDTTAILSDCASGFEEGTPPVGAMRAVEGQACESSPRHWRRLSLISCKLGAGAVDRGHCTISIGAWSTVSASRI